MADTYPIVRVAAVQASSVFLDRDATTEKACRLIREAGAAGARFIVFPEGFIPAHPLWYHHHVATSPKAMQMAGDLFRNSVEVPSSTTEALARAAKDANATVVMGVCEKRHDTMGTMYNTQVFFGPDGTLLGKHQKIMPTVGERIVHTGGCGDTFGAVRTDFGPMSALICGENTNPLAIFALAAENTRIHAMSWPPYIGPQAVPLRNVVEIKSKAFAMMAGAFVVSACGALDDQTLTVLELNAEHAERLRNPLFAGGSMIVAPNGNVISEAQGSEECIIYGDCDLSLIIHIKMQQDLVGHYNRSDIFQLHLNRTAPQIYATYTGIEGEKSKKPAPVSERKLPSLNAPSPLLPFNKSIVEEN